MQRFSYKWCTLVPRNPREEKKVQTNCFALSNDRKIMKAAIFLIFAFLLTVSDGSTQERKPTSISELAVYRGPDRESLLYAGAKTEGKLTWYTSLAGASYKELAKAFSAKYPGIELEPFRAPGADLVVRSKEARSPIFSESHSSTDIPLLFNWIRPRYV